MTCRATYRWLMTLLLATCALIGGPNYAAETTELKAKQIWQLLDYVAVDYGGAVANGAVLKASEYAEMQEFAATAERQLGELPDQTDKGSLLQQATALRAAVAAKADPVSVAKLAHALSSAVQKTYPFPVAPTAMPVLAKGGQLFQAQCAACHGQQGRGDGPLAASLNPKPTALADHTRARERSLFALHQIISNGVQGTAMQGFGALSDEDRWALAFFVGTLPYAQSDKDEGAKLWQANAQVRQTVASLDALTQTSEHVLADKLDVPSAKALTAYLRTNPNALNVNSPKGTAIAKAKLSESVTALLAGDRAGATKLALSAYLDGFEPVEPALATRNRPLFEKIEAAMVSYRALIANGSPADVQTAELHLRGLLDEADKVLAPSDDDAVAAFIGALTILLREGLEALLVVVAMLAFLKKAERKDVLIYVHAGWASALAAGGITWAVATYLVGVSGASRELTEGFSSLFAAVVLLGVGMWMHQKSVAGRWQVYLKEKLSSALNKRTAWFLFSLAFVAVYREVFETVLFFAALWTEGNGWPLLAGLGTGMGILALLAVVLLRTSARLPIGQFFAASSLLVAILAVVLAGKGIAGLQEAGLLQTSPISIPRIDLLGIYPSWQTLSAQFAVLFIVVVAFTINLRSSRQMAVQKS
ncbi:high-affinity iron transporter [Acidovorax temperans]|jgi:high-affinity iron transporter|uniref:High-affinity iron transporter n=4 Tax=Betaproteobacteria TaxID=28216 RepID=A0A543KTA7_9BURK|nr:c-type cytochrome [Caenimonas koreensis DSM 17982]TQM98296.1 high-affinity iron transporter [Acidovorax temperans]VWD43408.1 cytochrome C [Burkholderia aenigmatica]